jgi:2-oxoglutarate ferredoxin oxidoreductase subunit gamma
MRDQRIIISGFGGQGILSAGTILAYAGMIEGCYVSWLPSYGPEMRGGTANCHVIISDKKVGSPIINNCTTLIVMNSPSLEKFEKNVEQGGLIIADSTMVERVPDRNDITFVRVPATKLSSDMGKMIYANIILLGKLIAITGIISTKNFKQALEHVLPEKYHKLIPEEMSALDKGMQFQESQEGY